MGLAFSFCLCFAFAFANLAVIRVALSCGPAEASAVPDASESANTGDSGMSGAEKAGIAVGSIGGATALRPERPPPEW